MLDGIRRFFISADFYKSLTFILAALVPILLSYYCFSQVEIGFAIALGVFYNSPTNSHGSVKHRTVGMMYSIVLTTTATIITGFAASHILVLLPVLATLTFVISYISVFGFRASLVSLAGMLAVVISFANSYVNLSVFEYGFFVFIGGIWYLIVSSVLNFLNPKMYIEELLSDTMRLTGSYLGVRAELLKGELDRDVLQTKLFECQSQLSEKHEALREVILSQRQKSGFSNRIRRKYLLFTELVDMFELAIATPIDYNKVTSIFKNKPETIAPFVALIEAMASHLNYISKVIIRDEKVKGSSDIRALLKKIRRTIDIFKQHELSEVSNDGFYILVNLFEYQAAQAQKLNAMERVLNVFTKNNHLKKDSEGDLRFLTPQDYGLEKLRENFSMKSSIFRHSLRLSIAMVVGYLMGYLLSLQNPYWILITILVIMRPSYGLTKKRLQHRVLGTLIGAAIALFLVYTIQNTFVFGVLAALSLVLALSLVQLNYRTFAIFLTLHIVFLHAVFHPDVLNAIQYRITDTLLGAGLAMLSNLFLFPSWEFMTIEDSISKTLQSNAGYLQQIEKVYTTKSDDYSEYKLSRKSAFLNIGDLNAAFQRMTQEPKSRQKYFSEIYDLVVLSNTFLSSLASLGTFIQTHETTAISSSVKTFVSNILENINSATLVLQGKHIQENNKMIDVDEAALELEKKYKSLSRNFDKILLDNPSEEITALSLELQEAKLVIEQMSYLLSLSKSLLQKITAYKQD
ncbi:MAG: FUSC family membrane protein [Flavicella sp.]